MASELTSIVIPVYNEADNIQVCLRRLESALAGSAHEILICYDFEEDTTLAALAAMPDRPAAVRLVKNDLGRGAAFAIRSGFRAARGDVVVTTMADLSDPPEVIPAMADKIRREAADVVSASRYMRGGSQTGGPRLKGFLSRMAGLSLRWLTGLGTHDATNNFRAYSTRFLDRVKIQSDMGFVIALELTVKAHLKGFKVAEVPSSWVDRSAGESRFRMWHWMPHYLKWYLWAMAAPAFVWAVWALAALGAFYLVGHYSRNVPWWDEFKNVPYVAGETPVTAAWIWRQHNEHRMPVVKVIYVSLVKAAGGDFRAAPAFNALLLVGIAFAYILAARRIRGRTSFTDAFFALAGLHWGQSESILWGFQVQFTLSSALFCAVLVAIATYKNALTGRRIAVIGLCSALLPMCGAQGLFLVPPLVVWLTFVGVTGLRSSGAGEKGRGYLALLSAGLAAVSCAVYFVGLTSTRGMRVHPSVGQFVERFVEFLSIAFGPVVKSNLRDFAIAAIGLYLVLTALLVYVAATRPAQRPRALGFLAVLAGVLMLAASIGYGRGINGTGSGLAGRYVPLSLPLLYCAYLSLMHFGPRALCRAALVAGLVTSLVTFWPNTKEGLRFAYGRRRDSNLFARDVRMGMSSRDLAEKYHDSFYRDEDLESLVEQIEILRNARLGPFKASGRTR